MSNHTKHNGIPYFCSWACRDLTYECIAWWICMWMWCLVIIKFHASINLFEVKDALRMAETPHFLFWEETKVFMFSFLKNSHLKQFVTTPLTSTWNEKSDKDEYLKIIYNGKIPWTGAQSCLLFISKAVPPYFTCFLGALHPSDANHSVVFLSRVTWTPYTCDIFSNIKILILYFYFFNKLQNFKWWQKCRWISKTSKSSEPEINFLHCCI